ncbi:MAG TPA: radical SAM protein [Candidatus Thermoplasmatota archaeon]|nr:radical SAM protein [Candidatus Thermoplasmatota archaeon]
MRIALVSPKGPLYRHRTGIFRRSLRYAPLTLTTLASLVPPELDADVEIFDEGVEDVDPDAIEADLVGITVITGGAPRSYALAARLRARGVPVVLGGPHVTLVPDDARPHADSIVVGYAEDSWPALLRDFAAGRMLPRYDQAPDLSLAGRPFPRREMLSGRAYLTTNVFEATRACVHDCEFCVVPAAWGRRPLQKPVEDVVADVRQHVGHTKGKRLIFVDLNLIADIAYAKRLFRAFAPLKVRWFGLATTLVARDRELLDLAAESGCTGLLIGLESISADNLRDIHKSFNRPEDFADLVRALHERGIALMGCFVFGMDHDEPDACLRTARFAVETGIDLPRFAISTPFPGTALHKRLESEGRILTRDWELYDGQHVVFRPARMTVQELQEGHEAAWRHTYKATSIARRLGKARIQLPIAIAANLGYRFYARNLHRYYNCDWFVGQGAPRLPALPHAHARRAR